MQFDPFEILSLLAELAVGLVGFSGIVLAIRGNVGLIYMMCTAVALAVLAVLPFALVSVGVGESLIWSVLSALGALYQIVINQHSFRAVPDDLKKSPLYWLFVGGFYLFAVFGIANALLWHSFAAFLVLLCWFFVYVLVLFVRLIHDSTSSPAA